MALRYELPSFDNNKLIRDDNLGFAPRYPSPIREVFRPGADLAPVAKRLLEGIRVQLCAAVGSGKSVKIPAELAKESKKLIVHVMPSKVLAWQLYNYVSSAITVEATFVEGTNAVFPKKGVVFISGADLIGNMLNWRADGVAAEFVLFLDEAHESDCFTTVLRELGPSLPGVQHLILSSATFDPDGFRKVETAGSRRDVTFEEEPVAEWNADDHGKPWSASSVDDDTLLFVDRDKVANTLVNKYKEQGMLAFRLTARMPLKAFKDVMSLMASNSRPIVVLVADYSFRSGFTFPTITSVIDSGEVMYYDVVDGGPVKCYRRAFAFEVEQAAGRGGRVAGSKAVCHRPDWLPELRICDVEGVEVDAAALLFRMLGFKPPMKYQVSRYAMGDVPIDISAALRGAIPLRALSEEQHTTWVGGVPELPPVETEAYEPAFPVQRMPVMLKLPKGSRPPSPAFERLGLVEQDEPVKSNRAFVTPIVYDEPEIEQVRVAFNRTPGYVASGATTPFPEFAEPIIASTSMHSHARSVSSSSVENLVRVDSVGTEPSAEDFAASAAIAGDPSQVAKAFDSLLSSLKAPTFSFNMGEYNYYPGVERVVSATTMFPDGASSVLRCLQDLAFQRGLDYGDKLVAMKILLDAYNDSLLHVRAIRRVVEVFPSVQSRLNHVVETDVLKEWVVGLAEELTGSTSKMKAYAEALCEVNSVGYEDLGPDAVSALGVQEVQLASGYAQQLEELVSVRRPGASLDYVGGFVASRPRLALMGSMAKGRGGHSQLALPAAEMVARPATSLQLLRPQDQPMLAKARYKLQPESGASPFVTRMLMKLIGKGDIAVHLA